MHSTNPLSACRQGASWKSFSTKQLSSRVICAPHSMVVSTFFCLNFRGIGLTFNFMISTRRNQIYTNARDPKNSEGRNRKKKKKKKEKEEKKKKKKKKKEKEKKEKKKKKPAAKEKDPK